MAVNRGTRFNFQVRFYPKGTVADKVFGKLGLIHNGVNGGQTAGMAKDWLETGYGTVNINGYRDANHIASAIASALSGTGYRTMSVRVWF